MVKVLQYSLKVIYMRDSGKMTRQMVGEDLFMQMEKFTKVIGRKIRPTGMVKTLKQTELSTKVIGKKTNSTVRVKRHGLMVLVMKETTKRVRNMEKVF